MNTSIYFPAISVGSMLQSFKSNKPILGKHIKFYEKNDIFNYNKILISAGHNLNKINFCEEIGLDLTKNIVFGDSGGYQLATRALEYNETNMKRIFNWLENNSNYAAILDFPAYSSISNKKDSTGFLDCLEITYNNSKYFSDNQTGKTKFLNVLHSRSLYDFDIWYSKQSCFDFPGGWALGSLSMSSYLIILACMYLYTKGELNKPLKNKKLLHIFGVSDVNTIIIISYLQHMFNKKGVDVTISYDSSTPNLQASFGIWMYGYSLTSGYSSFRISNKLDDFKDLSKEVPFPCSCSVCSGLTWGDFSSLIREENGEMVGFKSDYYTISALHNLKMMVEGKKFTDNLIQINCKKMLFESILSKIRKMIEIIDVAFDSSSPLEYLESKKKMFNDFNVGKEKHDISDLFC